MLSVRRMREAKVRYRAGCGRHMDCLIHGLEAAMVRPPSRNAWEVTMESSSQEHGVESSKGDGDREARNATQRAIEGGSPSSLAANPFMSPFGFLSAFWGDVERMVRGLGMPALLPFPSGLAGVRPDRAGASGGTGDRPTWAPRLEVLRRDGEFVVRAEIPGIDKEHVNVEIQDGRAIISGERQEEHESEDEGVYRSERSYGRFSRVVALPEGANAEQAKATSADGVLEIVIPMANPERKAHRLEIHDGGAPEPGSLAEQNAEQHSRLRTPEQPRAKRAVHPRASAHRKRKR